MVFALLNDMNKPEPMASTRRDVGGHGGARGELILQQKMPLPELSNKDFS